MIEFKKEIVIQPEIKTIIKGFIITNINESPISQNVIANIDFIDEDLKTVGSKSIIVWEGQDYINIGQWTDTDLQNKIMELLNNLLYL